MNYTIPTTTTGTSTATNALGDTWAGKFEEIKFEYDNIWKYGLGDLSFTIPNYATSSQFRYAKLDAADIDEVKRINNNRISMTIKTKYWDGEVVISQDFLDKILKAIGEFSPSSFQGEALEQFLDTSSDEKDGAVNG
jgi:hypothetical protein